MKAYTITVTVYCVGAENEMTAEDRIVDALSADGMDDVRINEVCWEKENPYL